jgi:hypothetical protein
MSDDEKKKPIDLAAARERFAAAPSQGLQLPP